MVVGVLEDYLEFLEAAECPCDPTCVITNVCEGTKGTIFMGSKIILYAIEKVCMTRTRHTQVLFL